MTSLETSICPLMGRVRSNWSSDYRSLVGGWGGAGPKASTRALMRLGSWALGEKARSQGVCGLRIS